MSESGSDIAEALNRVNETVNFYKDIRSHTVLFECVFSCLLFSDIRDAKTFVFESNLRGIEHRNF